jgi:ribosome modulation factor
MTPSSEGSNPPPGGASPLVPPRRQQAVEELGRRAHSNGLARDLCPYRGGWQRDAWRAGWDRSETTMLARRLKGAARTTPPNATQAACLVAALGGPLKRSGNRWLPPTTAGRRAAAFTTFTVNRCIDAGWLLNDGADAASLTAAGRAIASSNPTQQDWRSGA